ncbi:MAG: hypothetical protein Q8R65_07815 [Polynucleobacter sp.]|nr:hypothetical protein [Polynucleobacter sp.]MDZ4055940.1 hypothetical protein [Polynucleobacter sp.]
MSQTINAAQGSYIPSVQSDTGFTQFINKISHFLTILHESSVEAKAQYKKHCILGGGWE